MGSLNVDGLDGGDAVFLRYVQERNLNFLNSWELCKSRYGGRGLSANHLLKEGELIFIEPFLICCPRLDPKHSVCAGCSRSVLRSSLCSRGCGINVCNVQCEKSTAHEKVCEILCKVETANSRERLALDAALRSLVLSPQDREVVKFLERHERSEHNRLLQRVENLLSEEDLNNARSTLEALDATSFETPSIGDGKASLRALYVLGAMMNHECSPNTRHCFDESGRMIVEATRDIEKGEELTITYTSLTWGNQARQTHLSLTKRFLCQCRRCADPTEFGANLMALYCMKKNCGSVILPLSPNLDVPWGCYNCGTKLSHVKMQILQTMVRNELKNLGTTDPKRLCRMLRKNAVVPGSNQAAIEFKFNIVNIYGHAKGFVWSDLRIDELELKRLICIELLTLLTLLALGKCRQRGLLIIELFLTLREMRKRGCPNPESDVLKTFPQYTTIEELYKEGTLILHYDFSARNLLNEAKQVE